MSLREDVQNASSPMEALLVLADAVDELASGTTSEPTSWQESWGAALDTKEDEVPQEDWLTAGQRSEYEAEIADLYAELRGNESDEESKIIRARIFLAEDNLKPPPDHPDLEQSRTIQVTDDSGNVTIDVPPPSDALKEERELFAREKLGLIDEYGEDDGETYIQSYVKAGPLILYLTDRDFVNSLPFDTKAAMVADVEEFSPAEAHEMGRDLLKDPDPGTPDIAIENTPTDETG